MGYGLLETAQCVELSTLVEEEEGCWFMSPRPAVLMLVAEMT